MMWILAVLYIWAVSATFWAISTLIRLDNTRQELADVERWLAQWKLLAKQEYFSVPAGSLIHRSAEDDSVKTVRRLQLPLDDRGVPS
jgi:hypothetical protein